MPLKRLFDSEKKRKRSDPQQEETLSGSNTMLSNPLAAQDEAAFGTDKIVTNEVTGPFYEKDNQALRIHRLSQADEFWSAYENWRPNIPFLRYVFDNQHQALEALLSITCIHNAEDTGHLICTAPITLGCYRIIDGRYEAFLAGEFLTYSIWSEATEKFSSHHGKYLNQLKPETNERFKLQKSASQQVIFKREYYQLDLTDTKFYQIFETTNTQVAWVFLLRRENVITDRTRYIHVETPEGIICRDANGIHRLEHNKDSGTVEKSETDSTLNIGHDVREHSSQTK